MNKDGVQPVPLLDKPDLTQRERGILRLVAEGWSAKEISRDLGIGPRTVERHIENIRHKLRARNKVHLITKAIRYGELKLVRVQEAV